MKKKLVFYTCSLCGKKLIGRKSNGTFLFMFGGNQAPYLVQIEIFGHVRMRCIRRSCRKKNPDHWNVFNFFPEAFSIADEDLIEDSKQTSANPATNEEIDNNLMKGVKA